MKWTALLLSMSGYGWYLVFASSLPGAHFGWGTSGLSGLILLAVIPAFAAYGVNRRLLASGSMVLKVVLLNLLQFLFYSCAAGLTSYGAGLL